MNLPAQVKIVEVSPRDGLQNEALTIELHVKLELIQRLIQAGLHIIEVTSFVSPKWIPQLADHVELFSSLPANNGINFPVLVPNLKGLERALSVGVREIAVFAAASETFSRKNIHASIAESMGRFAELIPIAKENGVRVRGYVSCVLGCPYEGKITPEKVLSVAEELYQMGCDEISLGDTIGLGTPLATSKLIQVVNQKVPREALAVHFHDTYGQALANIYSALQEGICIIDSSVAGLGGCPYAPGAAGNVATEDVVYMLNGLGIHTGIDLMALAKTGAWISEQLGRPSRSKAGLAILGSLSE